MLYVPVASGNFLGPLYGINKASCWDHVRPSVLLLVWHSISDETVFMKFSLEVLYVNSRKCELWLRSSKWLITHWIYVSTSGISWQICMKFGMDLQLHAAVCVFLHSRCRERGNFTSLVHKYRSPDRRDSWILYTGAYHLWALSVELANTVITSTYITKTPPHTHTHTYTHITKPPHTHTHTLQNPHIHTPTHYKTHTYTHPHITKPTHIHTHTLENPTYTHPHITKPPHTPTDYKTS